MTWFDKHKRSRHLTKPEKEASAEKLTAREALAVSVEGLTEKEKSPANEWGEEEEEEEEDAASLARVALIPPRLHLQSRSLPIVRMDVTKHEPATHEGTREATPPAAAAPVRRLGRSTRVRLQAVRAGQAQEPITERVPIVEASVHEHNGEFAHDGQVLVRRVGSPVGTSPESSPLPLLCGSGVIEAGQKDAQIHNPHISEKSVVMVMLSGDPGPVVVHYVSLQPRSGFTLHMSAPVTTTTAFNYAAWLF